MYPLLSRFLIDNLDVLAAVLEQNIAKELEEILTKIKDKELTIKEGNNQITTIINSIFETEKEENEENLELEKIDQNDSKNYATASLRAPVGYHLPNAMKTVEIQFGKVFEKFGGHPCAAGFSVLSENLPIAKEKLSQIISEQIAPETDQKSYVEANFTKKNPIPEFLKTKTCKKNLIWLTKEELRPEIIKEVWQLEPFGQDFEMPQFMLCLTIINNKLQGKKYFNEFALNRQKKLGVVYTWLGKEQKHLKVEINEVKITIFNIPIDLKKKLLEVDDSKITIWLRTRISQNTWQDATTIELLSEELWLGN